MTEPRRPIVPPARLNDAAVRVAEFLAVRSKPGIHDPEVIYSINDHELRTSDLRVILAALPQATR